ncbi:protein phosphatase 2C domain-containing protein [Luteimonas sp. S4-F44]|uniref:PP2C family serine/threonine-protein phosphatase n=1 Tax=Luteimonas sp. S4-F44 TaxID=2925842 RepID=UPI001F53406C|nr:PP2C family serine/threonine-protein phosphatase [Luteimonas sp. S4-F44]UNK43744.1 protein phosphatase 2C domain-containing protein [Luteimonas sp. S4-F44]
MDLQAWRLAAASALGTSHWKTGAPCQDAHAWALLGEDPVLVLVAADGAGSASRSDSGAQLATAELLDSVRGFLNDGNELSALTRETAQAWIRNVVARISHRADQDGMAVREYACTLLAAIVSPDHACFLQIGDGAMVVRPRGDDWAYIFWPQHGEFINQTVFVTDPAAIDNVEFSSQAGPIDEVAAFTDGIEALVLHYASQTVHGPFFDRMFQAVRALPMGGIDQELSEKLDQYLSSPVVCERTDDDKTLILASRLPPYQPTALSAEAP